MEMILMLAGLMALGAVLVGIVVFVMSKIL